MCQVIIIRSLYFLFLLSPVLFFYLVVVLSSLVPYRLCGKSRESCKPIKTEANKSCRDVVLIDENMDCFLMENYLCEFRCEIQFRLFWV